MLNAQLLRFPGRMQRIGEQQQPVYQFRLSRTEHARLPPSVGVAAQEDASRQKLPHRANGILQTFPVAPRIPPPRRTVRAQLPVRKIHP